MVTVSSDNKMAGEGCFALSVFGLLNDVTFHTAKCCAEVKTKRLYLNAKYGFL